jgi:hypothetical protein
MAFDVAKWLKDEMKFSDAEATEMAAKFSGERASALEAGYASASDRATIAANRDDANRVKADLEAKTAKLNAEIAEWATLTTAEKGQADDLRASLEASQAEVLRVRQVAERVAAQAGVDLKTLLPAEPVKKVEEPVKFDTSKFVDRDTFSTLSRYTLEASAAMPYIAEEHRELTGKRLDTRTLMAEIQKRATQPNAVMDPVKIWEEMHSIPALRETKAAEARAAEISAAETRGEERARSSMAVPGAHQTRSVRPSPVLSVRQENGQFATRTSALKRPIPQSTVMSAASAFRSHKYREKAS